MQQVGNLEGRAGMVAIVDPKHEVDLDALAKGLDKNLPIFARPLFLRILSEITLTGMALFIFSFLSQDECKYNE